MADETTTLSPGAEAAFRKWVAANRIADVDHPDSHYDYRGYFQEHGAAPMQFGVDHFTDTYKQHGHPTFSQESQYSRGMADGGMWLNDTTLLQQPKMTRSRSPLEATLLARRKRGA